MTVVLLDREHPCEPDQAAVIAEDAADVGSPADLFQRSSRSGVAYALEALDA